MSLLYGNGTNGREENFGHLYKHGTALCATGKAKKRFLKKLKDNNSIIGTKK